jgi:hypothetical protein
VSVWCYWDGDRPGLGKIYPEVDGAGVAPLNCHAEGQALSVSFPLPPGLAPGRHEVRLRIGPHGWSAPREIFVDIPPWTAPVELVSAQDGQTYEPNSVSSRWLTIWVHGLSQEAGEGNTLVHVGDVPHDPDVVLWRPAEQAWQINVRLRACVPSGEHEVLVAHRGARSNVLRVTVTTDGERPKGLEAL